MATAKDLRRMALALEGTTEAPHFDRAAFKVARIYVTLAADGRTANFKFTPDEQEFKCMLAPDAFARVPNAWGKQGWTTANRRNLRTRLKWHGHTPCRRSLCGARACTHKNKSVGMSAVTRRRTFGGFAGMSAKCHRRHAITTSARKTGHRYFFPRRRRLVVRSVTGLQLYRLARRPRSPMPQLCSMLRRSARVRP